MPGPDEVDKFLQDLERYRSKADSSQAVTELFEKVPVPLDEFLYGNDFLGLERLSPVQYEFVAHGTQIYRDDTLALLGWPVLRWVTELIAQWGKSSGKDHVSMVILARVLYQLLCLKSPQRYFQMSKYSTIDVLNVAYSADQASDVFFAPFRQMLESSKFFSNMIVGSRRHMQLPKNLHAYSGHSFEEALEGKNLVVCILDEISAFKTREEVEQLSRRRMRAPRYAAEALHDMAMSSVTSRFPKVGKVVSLSYPRFKGDFIQQLYEAGKNETTAYVSFGATWDVNPTKKKSDFEHEYRKNPERASAKYECAPSGLVEGFYKHPDKIELAFPKILEEEAPTVPGLIPSLRPSWKSTHQFPCAVHIDLGWKVDSAGIAVSHISGVADVKIQEGERENILQMPIVEVDLVTSFIAPINGEIDFQEVREFILEVRGRGFRIELVTLDGFQSAEMIQAFNRLGIEAKVRSIDKGSTPHDDLKTLIYEGRIKGYAVPRRIERGGGVLIRYVVLDELEKLVMVYGRKVDHRVGGSKDEADAVAGSVQGALELGYVPSGFKSRIIEGRDRVSYQAIPRSGLEDREFLAPLE